MWLEFWDSFEGSIHNNEGLSDRDKFDHLKGLLDGPAELAVTGFTLTSTNYEAAIKMLQGRFGRPEEISRAHYDGMIQMKPVVDGRDIPKIRKLFDEVETHHRALLALGKDEDQYSDVFVPMIISKLPENLRVAVLSEKKTTWKMGEMLKTLGEKIREMSKPSGQSNMPKPHTMDEKERFKKPGTATASALATRSGEACAVCSGSHAHENCPKVTMLDERKKLVKKFGRCWICLRKGHRAAACRYQKNGCTECKGKDHVAICSSDESGEIVKSSSLHVRDGRSVALQTAQAIVTCENGKKAVKCRILFDSASLRTFVTAEIRKILQVEGECKKEWLGVSGFGDTGGDVKQCDVLQLKVQNVNGERKIDIAACVIPKITEGLKSERVNAVKLEYEHLNNLQFSDLSTKETVATDVLIGADYLWYFQGGDVIKGQPGEPVAIKTVLGYVLSGPVHGVKSEKVSTNLVINETKENLQLERQVMQLWDYDSIGIQEQNEVNEYLLENIEYTGERYRVRLPWKIGHPFLPDNYNLSLGRLKSQLRRLKNEPDVLREYD